MGLKSFKSWIFLDTILMIGIFLLLPVDTAHAQESLEVEVTVESMVVPQTGEVIVSGTVTCSEPTTGSLVIVVSQPVGRLKSISGESSTNVACDENGEPYTLSVFASSGSFKPGTAVLEEVSFFACAPSGDCGGVELPPQAVTLRP